MTIATIDTIDTIDIGKEFAINPRGVRHEDSDVSAQRFREEFLEPIFTSPEKYSRPVKIVLHNAVGGFGASFLDEAFGELVRKKLITPANFDDTFELVADRGGFWLFARMIRTLVAEAAQEQPENQQRVGAG